MATISDEWSDVTLSEIKAEQYQEPWDNHVIENGGLYVISGGINSLPRHDQNNAGELINNTDSSEHWSAINGEIPTNYNQFENDFMPDDKDNNVNQISTRLEYNHYQVEADDHFHVEDDTSILVPTDGATEGQSHRYRRPHGLRHGSARNHGIANGRPPGTHACHSGKKSEMDKTARNQLIAVSVLCTVFMVAEIVGGVLSNSLALVTDATHMASDLTSFLVSLIALWLATKPPSRRMTFGYHRAEVLGALISVLIIWVVTGVLVYSAVRRIQHNHYDIEPDAMLITAAVGVGFNIIMAIVLHSGISRKCRLPTSLGHNHSHAGHGHHSNHSHLANHDNNHSNHVDPGYQDTDNPNHITHLNPQLLRHMSTTPGSNINSVAMETSPQESADRSCDNKTATYNKNINIRAAIIHVIGDLIQSIGVLLAAIIIKIKVTDGETWIVKLKHLKYSSL